MEQTSIDHEGQEREWFLFTQKERDSSRCIDTDPAPQMTSAMLLNSSKSRYYKYNSAMPYNGKVQRVRTA